MSEPTIINSFSNWRLVDLHLHIDSDDWQNNTFEIVAELGEKRRHLKFLGARNIKIDEEFHGNLSGMYIRDISGRQWANTNIEVGNLEQDPGVTLLAWQMETVNDT